MQPLSDHTIATVKATVPALAQFGTDITRAMYLRLFRDEHIAALFNHSHQGNGGTQTKALANAILTYASNIDNLGVLTTTVERIAQRHVGLQILPEHYPYVADALLGAIGDVLGEAATREILNAWGEAFWFLANVLMNREKILYTHLAGAQGGWSGWREFVVSTKTRESETITSFLLRPRDGGTVIRHKPGQYLSFLLPIPNRAPVRRHYSISSAPNGQTYKISVKREEHGAASSWLHDHVLAGDILRVSPPAGDFFLADKPQRPVVLLSGGVGLTPMISMLETIAQLYPHLPTHYVHGTTNGATHAMDQHVRVLVHRHSNIRAATFYSDPARGEEAGVSHDVTGFISIDWLRRNTPFEAADFYLCGPKAFLRAIVGGLTQAGIPPDQIHYEFFGPTEEVLAA